MLSCQSDLWAPPMNMSWIVPRLLSDGTWQGTDKASGLSAQPHCKRAHSEWVIRTYRWCRNMINMIDCSQCWCETSSSCLFGCSQLYCCNHLPLHSPNKENASLCHFNLSDDIQYFQHLHCFWNILEGGSSRSRCCAAIKVQLIRLMQPTWRCVQV